MRHNNTVADNGDKSGAIAEQKRHKRKIRPSEPRKNKRGCTSGVAVGDSDCDTAMLILKRNGIEYSGTVTL